MNLTDADEIKEYVIKDNLLRRHLKPEQRAPLERALVDVRSRGSGGDRKSIGFHGTERIAFLKKQLKEPENATMDQQSEIKNEIAIERRNQTSKNKTFDVYAEVAKEVGQSRAAIAGRVQYARLVEKRPEMGKLKVSQANKAVLRREKSSSGYGI